MQNHTIKPSLELKHICKYYGMTTALENACLSLYPGEVHALMGENGAGKSTLINIISGARQPDAGQIILNGTPVKFRNTNDPINNGIAVVYQELSLIPHLTVMENISVISSDISRKIVYDWRKSKKIAQHALKILGEVAEEINPNEITSNLRTNQLQIVEIARAVSTGAKIILLDEPTSSLNCEETQSLFNLIKQLCKVGISFIFVSHRMNEIREISDRITVLRDGRTVLDGKPICEVSDKLLLQSMLGQKFSDDLIDSSRDKSCSCISEEPILNVQFKHSKKKFTLRKGEVIGVAGLSGSGRSALLRYIWGAEKRGDIDLELYGFSYAPKSPNDALKRNIGYIGEDRSRTGLFVNLPCGETLMMPKRYFFSERLVKKEETSVVEKLIKTLNVKIAASYFAPGSLSGGNQQKLLFGKWLVNKPKLFLLDEPTRGVDVHTKNDIYKLIRKNVEEGASCLVVTSEISEMELLCDRVIIMRDGQMVGELVGDEVNENRILAEITMACDASCV